jgi:dihydrofolate reductase
MIPYWRQAAVNPAASEGEHAIADAVNQPGRDIGVPGGIRTAQAFARLGLIDEYVLMMHPVALGEGQRIFSRRTDLDLHSAKAYRSGVTRLIYRPR